MTLVALTLLLTTQVALTAAGAGGQDPGAGSDPDDLYAQRAQLDHALEAAAIWEGRLAGGAPDFEAAWKLARACYWLGAHVPAAERRRQYERGIVAGKRAVEIAPGRPEGHFWLAANMGTLAEAFGLRAGLRYRGPVKRTLETVLAIDPAYDGGAAHRALGRWYLKVPGLFGGSKQKSVEHLRRALGYDPTAAVTHFFLAETYLAMGRKDDARQSLRRVLEAPVDPDWVPEVAEFKQRARALLAELERR